MLLYTYGFREAQDIKIDKILLWFTRPNRKITIPWKKKDEEKTIKWAKEILKEIKEEQEFSPNTSSDYFCNYLCGVREHCEYRGQ
jgi:CRISPR/Cas system-associated exonuclease Cas4 (RecB family)